MKKTGKILKKALGLLTVLTMMVSCLAVISVSAEVGEGNKIVSIDSLWTTVGETETKLASTHAGYAPSNHPSIGDRAGSGIYVGYETGNSGNVVLKNGSNESGVWNYKNNGIPSTNRQKWEVKVKFETTSDDVYLFGFANNGYLYPQAHDSATRTDAKYGSWVKITNGYVQVAKNGNWTSLNSATLLANTWYTVVRYVDFSTSGNILNRVLVFDNAGELVVDSGTSWLVCSDMTGKANLVGFEVSSGNVMFDDFAIYEVLDSNMSQAMHYPVAGESTAKDYTIDSYLWNAVEQETAVISGKNYPPYDLSIADTVERNNSIMIDKESEDSTNIVLENSEGQTGVWMYRTSTGYNSIPTAKKQKWEVKVKLSSDTDSVKLFGYSSGSYYDYKNERCVDNSAYSNYGTFVKINGGDVKIGNTGSTTIGTDCIVANKWYTVVRYMDFTTSGTTYDRVLVYDDAGEVVADSGEWKMSGRMTNVPKALIFTVESGSTCVQFDDLALYEVSSFDALSAEDASITLGEIKIAFSKPMDAETFDADAVTLTSAGRNIELKSVSYNEADNTILIGFNQLLYNTAYTLRIDNEVMKIDVEDYIDWYPTSPFVFDFTTEADPLTVGAVVFKDADGNEILATETLNTGDTVKGSAVLVNTSATPRPYLVIIAIYEGVEMVDVKAVSGTISNTGDAGSEIMTDELTVEHDNSRAEVFVWDSWTTIRPLVEKATLPTPAL